MDEGDNDQYNNAGHSESECVPRGESPRVTTDD